MPSDAVFPISAKKSKTPPNNRFAMPSETVSDGIVSTRHKPMKAFTKITAIVAPLDRSNVDTDAIIPKQFLKSIKRSGFGIDVAAVERGDDGGDFGKGFHVRFL